MAKGKYETWQEDDNITLLGAWARDGLTQAQIAKNMGIALSTLKEWIKKYPAISAALKKGKELADYEMENTTGLRDLRQAINWLRVCALHTAMRAIASITGLLYMMWLAVRHTVL